MLNESLDMKLDGGATIGLVISAYSGALSGLMPEGMTTGGVTAAAVGAFLYVFWNMETLKTGQILSSVLRAVGIYLTCFFVGIFASPAVVGKIWLIGTIEFAALVCSGAGAFIFKGIQSLGQKLPAILSRLLDTYIEGKKK